MKKVRVTEDVYSVLHLRARVSVMADDSLELCESSVGLSNCLTRRKSSLTVLITTSL